MLHCPALDVILIRQGDCGPFGFSGDQQQLKCIENKEIRLIQSYAHDQFTMGSRVLIQLLY